MLVLELQEGYSRPLSPWAGEVSSLADGKVISVVDFQWWFQWLGILGSRGRGCTPVNVPALLSSVLVACSVNFLKEWIFLWLTVNYSCCCRLCMKCWGEQNTAAGSWNWSNAELRLRLLHHAACAVWVAVLMVADWPMSLFYHTTWMLLRIKQFWHWCIECRFVRLLLALPQSYCRHLQTDKAERNVSSDVFCG